MLLALGTLVAGTAPATMLLFPLLCREHGWSSRSAGLMEAAFMAAALAVGAMVAARGALHRAEIALIGGPLLAGTGLLVAAGAPAVWVACAAAGVVIGATAFTVWAQSVVNEKVYTVSLVGLAVVSWITVRWCDDPDGPKADRLLVLVAFLSGLGYANHMAGFLALPNVLCVGGSWVAPDAAVKGGRWDEIERLAREASALASR